MRHSCLCIAARAVTASTGVASASTIGDVGVIRLSGDGQGPPKLPGDVPAPRAGVTDAGPRLGPGKGRRGRALRAARQATPLGAGPTSRSGR